MSRDRSTSESTFCPGCKTHAAVITADSWDYPDVCRGVLEDDCADGDLLTPAERARHQTSADPGCDRANTNDAGLSGPEPSDRRAR